jgi:hypothetical protein
MPLEIHQMRQQLAAFQRPPGPETRLDAIDPPEYILLFLLVIRMMKAEYTAG